MNMDVIAALAMVAARKDMEKQAGRFLSALAKPFTRPAASGMGRAFSGARTAKVLGGTAAAGGMLYGQHGAAQNSPESHLLNPFSWGGWGGAQQQHDRSAGNYTRLNNQAQEEIRGHIDAGNFDKADAVQKQLESGSYGGSMVGALGGLNPFYRAGIGAYGKDVGRINTQDQERMTRLESNMRSRQGMPGFDQSPYDKQMKVIRDRMTSAGNTVPGLKAKMQAASGPTPAGSWQMGNRPGYPGAVQGWALNPYDFRRDPSSNNVWEDVLARSGQGGQMRPY